QIHIRVTVELDAQNGVWRIEQKQLQSSLVRRHHRLPQEGKLVPSADKVRLAVNGEYSGVDAWIGMRTGAVDERSQGKGVAGAAGERQPAADPVDQRVGVGPPEAERRGGDGVAGGCFE